MPAYFKTFSKNRRGSTLIGALVLLLVFGFLGAAAVELGSGEQESSTNDIGSRMALYIGQAGLEYAKDLLNNGQDPTVADKPFNSGAFTITTDPSVGTVTVSSSYGNAGKEQSILADFAKDCVSLDATAAYVEGNALKNVKLIKTCNAAVTLSQIVVDWNWPQCGIGEGTTPYEDYADPDQEGHIFICHVPACDPDKANTLSVPVTDWESGGHANHDCDYLGECCDDGGCNDGGAGSGSGSGSDEATCSDFDHDGDHDHGGAVVDAIGFNGASVYNSALGVGAPTPGGAQPTTTIDMVDAAITANDTYFFSGGGDDIVFSTTPVASGWYMITVTFLDGSSIYTIFTL